MLKWFWSFYGGDNEETATLNPNSMCTLPANRFNNFARIKGEIDEDSEPYDSIYHYQRIKRLKNKRIREIMKEENFIDKNSDVNFWFYNRYRKNNQ